MKTDFLLRSEEVEREKKASNHKGRKEILF